MEKHWYAISAHPGYEHRVKAALMRKIHDQEMQEWFGDIVVPTEKVWEFAQGVKRIVDRRMLPGYLLVQVALTGETWHLIRSTPRVVEKFDYRVGTRFSTYATWWIRQNITRGLIDTGKTIRIPVHRVESHNKIIHAARHLQRQLGRDPRPDELAKEMGYTVPDLLKVMHIQGEPLSLQTPIGDNDDELGEFVQDHISATPEEQVVDATLRSAVRRGLAILTPREEAVIRMRFGIGEKREYTLEELGEKFAITRERIRQLEQRSLRILRNPSLRRRPLASDFDASVSLN